MTSNTPPILPAASRLGGYEILGLVGRGGMGEVYRAKQLSMDREVALKVLAPRLAKDPAFAEQFVVEARAAGKLNHPNIVGVHDVGQASAPQGCGLPAGEPVHYFSMEFVDGETVKDVIERQGAVDLATVGKVMLAMAEALAFAEAHKVVHRDIKPDNIMLTSDGMVKLADLGLALQADSAEAVAGSKDEQGRGKVMGTPLYMPPEQARAQPLDHRADQYALGATLFHMLTGRPPYQGESAKAIMRAHCFEPVPDPADANPEVPACWRALCLRMLAKSPTDRFAGAAELHAEVKDAVRWKPGTAPRARVGRGKAADRAGPPWGTIIVASACVLLVMGGLRLVTQRSQPSETGIAFVQPDTVEPALARAKARLAALPEEPSAALPVVEALLADPSLTPARSLIQARRDTLLTTIEDRRRNAVRAMADMIEVKIAAGDLSDARDDLARLPEEGWLTDRRRHLSERLSTAERVAENRLATSIDTAENATACDRLVNDITRSGLPESRRQALHGRLDRRRAELAPRPSALPPAPTPTPTSSDASSAWRELGERCEPQRAAPPYSGLIEALRNSARGFSNEDRVLLEAIASFVESAQQAESALRLHLGQATPMVEGRLGNRSGTFVLTRLEKDWIHFRLPEVPAESRAERASAVLPWAKLLASTLSGPEAPRQTAAYLWYWRQAEARSAISRLNDEALSTALATYERRARPLDIAGDIERRAAGQLAISYPFATARESSHLGDWPGAGGEVVERGLRWASATTITAGSAAEKELPGLRWKTALKAPMTLEATVQPEPGSDVVLVGITSGGLTVRVGLNPKRQGFYLATKNDGSGSYEALGSNPPPEYNPNDWSRIRLSVDAAGTCSGWLNDRPLTCDRALAFPPDAKLSPVIQGRPVKRGVGLMVSQLSVTGRL